MKVFISIIALGLYTQSHAHTLKESMKMIDGDLVNRTELIVKHKRSTEHKSFSLPHRVYSSQVVFEAPLFKQLGKVTKGLSKVESDNLGSYRLIHFSKFPSKTEAKKLLQELYAKSDVEFAFFSPKVRDANLDQRFVSDQEDQQQRVLPTPSFVDQQDYLKETPVGVEAQYAWNLPGGTGKNVKIIDIETGINATHEDLNPLFYLGELPNGIVEHGTAVAGIMVGKKDEVGVTGISFDSKFGFMSRLQKFPAREGEGSDYHDNVARVIEHALTKLEKGDLIVLEMHSYGPRGQFIPVEYWKPIFDILKVAAKNGVFCVAAGGNGYQNLDHIDYQGAFDPEKRNSECILVGAALKNKKKARFSNYGKRIDAFGYGRNVTTAGYGDLYNRGTGRKYTRGFSGTSSATPIVGGTMALLSSIAQEKGVEITPAQLQKAYHNTGVAQVVDEGQKLQRIGNFPNLKELIDYLKL